MIRNATTRPTFVTLAFSLIYAACLFLAPNSPVSAAEGKLTSKKAHAAVLRFFGGQADKVEVTGVLEIPQQNAAQADLVISNWIRKTPQNDPVTAYAFGPGGEAYTWSGRAKAIFAHYNDGRWMLTTIVTDTATWSGLNIAVDPW